MAIVRVNNLPVASGTAAAFARLKAAFEAEFPGVKLSVFSGYRSYDEQATIFRERYRIGAISPWGDYRKWLGFTWGRVSGLGTVAVPGTSNHGNGRALDIQDSAPSPGVTRYGNARSRWIANNAWRFGFRASGYLDFNEPWHIEYQGDQWAEPIIAIPTGESTPAPVEPETTEAPAPEVPEEEDDMAKNTTVYYTRASDKADVYMVFNTDSGFYAEHAGVDEAYNVSYGTALEAPRWAKITEAHAKVIKAMCERVLTRA